MLSASAYAVQGWMWFNQFPWVYSDNEKGWLYLHSEIEFLKYENQSWESKTSDSIKSMGWLWIDMYPFAYSQSEQGWLYIRGAADGSIYAYRNSTKEWEVFTGSGTTNNDFSNNDEDSTSNDDSTNNGTSTHTADLNASVAMEMIWVEPGSFTMGSPTTEEWRSNYEIQHEVTLTKGFYLGKYEVTQAQYEAVMTGNTEGLSATPSNWPNNPDRPVEAVSWEDIQKFLARLNSQQAGNIPEGWAYVLPTEAQWEYACRAGTTTVYSWGDSISASDANNNSYIGQTTDVGSYSANPWGFFDMHGNVWEWTADWYEAYSSGAQTDPEGPATGSKRVLRGGSWNLKAWSMRSASRSSYSPSIRRSHVGFRVGFQQQ